MRCLITGASGFIGSFLVEFLLERGCCVHALDRVEGSAGLQGRGDFHFHSIDVADGKEMARCVRDIQPDIIFHLAAQSYPRLSWDEPELTLKVNVAGSLNILEAVRSADIRPTILMVGSSAEYAADCGPGPIGEEASLCPSSPYGISKLAAEHLARLYFERYGIPIVRVRPFFLIGPRKRDDVSSDFARGIVAIERGEQENLSVGNLDVVRDLLDVRDGVAAFWLLSEQGEAGDVYNICSGTGYSARQVLEMLKAVAKVAIREQVDPSRLRQMDEMVRIGDPGKLKALGWMPTRSAEQTLKDILDYWRSVGSTIEH